METQATPKSRLQSLRLDDAVYAQLVELDERLKPIRGGKQVSALFCRAVELGLYFADDLHASSHLQSTDHKQTTVRIPPALLARVLAVGEQITMRPTVVMRSAARRGLPLLTAEVELELTAPASATPAAPRGTSRASASSHARAALLERSRLRAHPRGRLHGTGPGEDLVTDLKKIRRNTVASIRRKTNSKLYDSGFQRAINKKRGILAGSRPLRLWAPKHEIELNGFSIDTVIAVTEDGLMVDAHGGGCTVMKYADIALEDLIRFDELLNEIP